MISLINASQYFFFFLQQTYYKIKNHFLLLSLFWPAFLLLERERIFYFCFLIFMLIQELKCVNIRIWLSIVFFHQHLWTLYMSLAPTKVVGETKNLARYAASTPRPPPPLENDTCFLCSKGFPSRVFFVFHPVLIFSASYI